MSLWHLLLWICEQGALTIHQLPVVHCSKMLCELLNVWMDIFEWQEVRINSPQPKEGRASGHFFYITRSGHAASWKSVWRLDKLGKFEVLTNFQPFPGIHAAQRTPTENIRLCSRVGALLKSILIWAVIFQYVVLRAKFPLWIFVAVI